jgi:rubrerythrin
LAIADNRAGEVGLAWDGAGLASLLNEGADLSAFWREDELAGIMTAAVAGLEKEAPEEFKEVGEDIETAHTCPSCGYKWSGGK